MQNLNKIWFDLEFRKDIDDLLTLLYAMERGLHIKAISINNPSVHELRLLSGLFLKTGKEFPVFVTGAITQYEPEGDIHPCLFSLCAEQPVEHSFVDTKDAFLQGAFTVFCGGSLTTLSEILSVNNAVNAVIQGGYASYKIVPEHAVIHKFKKRDKVPTWNLNLDLKATEHVLASGASLTFVSKNICHSSWTKSSQVKTGTLFFDIFDAYLKHSDSESKCLHDVLALMAITDPELITFKPVSLFHTEHDIPKWWSEIKDGSNIKISVDYDQARFFHNLLTM